MGRIDESRAFIPVGIAILTISDSRDAKSDESGDVLQAGLIEAGHQLAGRAIVHDDIDEIQNAIRTWVTDPSVDVVIATGGTGITGRDVTPEAFAGLYDKEIPGFGEIFRLISYDIIGTSTIQSRATAGVAATTLLFALPGSPSACRDGWNKILKDQLDSRHRPCNFTELLPRLGER